MDSLRGQDEIEDEEGFDHGAIEAPPVIDAQERRMHVRAYNYWVSLLGNRCLPSIEDLNPEEMEDFSPHSVLLDFSMGLENPAILYLGAALREECGITSQIERISEVPVRSLLSRLTDHYLQIIANAAPVGFEAEFTNQRDATILYRGILMPFSSDDETIDFIYGVINWKEVASDSVVQQLGDEMRATLNSGPPVSTATPIWADGPSATSDFENEGASALEKPGAKALAADFGFEEDGISNSELDLSDFLVTEVEESGVAALDGLDLDSVTRDQDGEQDDAAEDVAAWTGADDPARILSIVSPLASAATHMGTSHRSTDEIAVALDKARLSAADARECDVRSRAALYRAIGDAYDFALSTREAPDVYQAMLESAAISVQERSPMTGVIKLVFGTDYARPRIAEYALVLEYALLQNVPQGSLAAQLAAYEGGLKGLVQDMRAMRGADASDDRAGRRFDRAVRKLSHAKPAVADALPFGELGLAVVVARREADGSISLLAGVDLQDKAAQKVMVTASKAL